VRSGQNIQFDVPQTEHNEIFRKNTMVKGKILVIEDSDSIRAYIQKVLNVSGFEALGAEDGSVGLKQVAANSPDLILCDIVMPGIDGFEVCRRLKADESTKSIPIIFLSSMTQSKDIVKGFELGIVDYVTKPFNEYELLSRVNTHFDVKKQRDIIESQRKELKTINEELDFRNSELQKINDSKDKIFSIISHDLRGPIGSFENVLEILSSDMLSESEKTELLAELKEQSKNIHQMLENLLQWSLSQRKEIYFKPVLVQVIEIAESVVSLLSATARKKHIELEVHVDDDCTVFADTDMLHLIIRNLISNSIKFTPENGLITLSVYSKEKFVEIHVTDTGVGISDENIEKVFGTAEYFTTRGTNYEKGSGLGLKLCKEFVEKHGGNIWAERRKEGGSAFIFTIPHA
jgi:signal transduction histidine kinase